MHWQVLEVCQFGEISLNIRSIIGCSPSVFCRFLAQKARNEGRSMRRSGGEHPPLELRLFFLPPVQPLRTQTGCCCWISLSFVLGLRGFLWKKIFFHFHLESLPEKDRFFFFFKDKKAEGKLPDNPVMAGGSCVLLTSS